MKPVFNLGFALGLAVWTFVMGGFYGLINFGGDFIQWLNAAFLGLAPGAFSALVDTLQSLGFFVCLVIWLCGVALLFVLRQAGFVMVSASARRNQTRGPRGVDGPVVDSTVREL